MYALSTFDICRQEYLNYDSPANGGLHVLIPSRLLAFPCPVDLPAAAQVLVAETWHGLSPRSESRSVTVTKGISSTPGPLVSSGLLAVARPCSPPSARL